MEGSCLGFRSTNTNTNTRVIGFLRCIFYLKPTQINVPYLSISLKKINLTMVIRICWKEDEEESLF